MLRLALFLSKCSREEMSSWSEGRAQEEDLGFSQLGLLSFML